MTRRHTPAIPVLDPLPLDIPPGLPLQREADGSVRVSGTRVHFWLVARCLGAGDSVADVVSHFPALSASDVQALARFTKRNRSQVEEHLRILEEQERVISDVLQRWEEAHPNPVSDRLRAFSRG